MGDPDGLDDPDDADDANDEDDADDAADAGGQTLFVWLFQSLHTFSLLRRKGIAGDGVWYCLVWHTWHCLGCLVEATDPCSHCSPGRRAL